MVSSSNSHLFQSFFQAFGNLSKSGNYDGYHHHPNVLHLSQSSLVSLFAFFDFHSARTFKSTIQQVLFIIIIFTPWEFFTSALADGLSLESEWQVFSCLQDSSQYFGWSHQCYSLDGLHSSSIFKSSSPFTNLLLSVSRAPITIGINITFMFHNFFNSLARSKYLSFFSLSFISTLWSDGTVKSTILQVLFFFLLIIIRSGRLTEIWWFVFISKSQMSLCVSFSRGDSGLCIYHLFVWSNFNFLHISQ